MAEWKFLTALETIWTDCLVFFFNKVCLTGWLDDINDIHDWSLIVWFGVQITAILYFIHSVDLRFTKTDYYYWAARQAQS